MTRHTKTVAGALILALTAVAGTAAAQSLEARKPVPPEHLPIDRAPAGHPANAPTIDQQHLEQVASESKDARFRVDELVHDFGTVFDDQPQTHTFRVHNDGTSPLVLLSTRASCGCTVPELGQDERVIEPGAHTDIQVSYRPHGRMGPQEQTVRVQTNDVETPLRELKIKAMVKPRVYTDPKVLQFGRVGRSQGGEIELRVAGWDEGFESPLASVQNPGVFEIERIGVEEKGKVDLAPNQDGVGEFEVPVTIYRVRLLADAATGRHQSAAVIRTNVEGHSLIQIPLMAEIVSPVQAVPRFLMLGRLDPGQEVSKSIRLQHTGGQPFEILSHEFQDESLGFTFQARPLDPANPTEYEITVTGVAPETGSVFRSNIAVRVKTTEGEETIDIPVSAALRPRQS